MLGGVSDQSGSYFWSPPDDPEPEWLARQFARMSRLPLRFYMDVGLLENGAVCLPSLPATGIFGMSFVRGSTR